MFLFMYVSCFSLFVDGHFDLLAYLLIYDVSLIFIHDVPWLTCVWVNPKLAASSARSGSAKYCVRWNRRLSCCSWRELYIVRGFLIFFPFPFTRSPVSSILSGNNPEVDTLEVFWNSILDDEINVSLAGFIEENRFSNNPLAGVTWKVQQPLTLML